MHQTAGENIFYAQAKQQRDYNRPHQVSNNIQKGQKVFLKNTEKGYIFMRS